LKGKVGFQRQVRNKLLTSAHLAAPQANLRATRWRTGLLRKVHALLVAMLRGTPTLILDSCSVRAKRGGDLTGPNPTAARKARNTT